MNVSSPIMTSVDWSDEYAVVLVPETPCANGADKHVKPTVMTECGETMIKIHKEFIFYYLSVTVVFTLKQEVSKHNQLLSLVLSFCFTNLCPKFQLSWVTVEAHDTL